MDIGVGKHRVLMNHPEWTCPLIRLAEKAAGQGQPMSMATRYEDSNWYLFVEISPSPSPDSDKP